MGRIFCRVSFEKIYLQKWWKNMKMMSYFYFWFHFYVHFFHFWWSWYLINANLRESHVGIWHGAECNMTNIFQAFLIKQLVTYFICQKNIHPIFFISFFIGKIYTFASNLNTFVNFLFICIFLNLKKIFFFIFYLHFLKFRITFYFWRLLQ